VPLLHIDPALEGKQVERLKKTKEERSQPEVDAALIELKKVAESDGNMMYPIIEAARARTTEGEMIIALQEVFGTYTETPVF
jgi:methylmalonyl-CoA mutase N-terminal domain/subunit